MITSYAAKALKGDLNGLDRNDYDCGNACSYWRCFGGLQAWQIAENVQDFALRGQLSQITTQSHELQRLIALANGTK